jgi:hypothetical protein
MVSESSLLSSQELVMGPCPKQDESGGNNPRKLLNVITEIPLISLLFYKWVFNSLCEF